MKIEAAGRTDVGRRRKINEDNLWISPDGGLLVVADGMGGHDAGEVASRIVVSVIRDYLTGGAPLDLTEKMRLDVLGKVRSPAGSRAGGEDETTQMDLEHPMLNSVSAAITHANHHVYQRNQERQYADGTGMGTTIVGFWLPANSEYGVVFHVGDCRLYLYRDGRMQQLTRDHTLYQEWHDRGAVGNPPKRNIILRAVGPWQNVTADVKLQRVRCGDVYLLCSDGLTEMVNDHEIECVMAKSQHGSLHNACRYLVGKANERGGTDNITVVLARTTPG